MNIVEKLKNLAPYDPTIDQYPVKLDANESPYPWNSDYIQTVLENIAHQKLNRYPDPACQQLRETAAALYHVHPEEIVCGNGSDELISMITSAFNQKGDKILVTAPDFSMYAFYAHLAECDIVTLTKNPDLTFSADMLIETAKASQVNMVIFSNPCNPTGQGLSRNEVLKIAESLDCLIVVDEAYMDFWDQSILHSLYRLNNVIVLKTCSKAFALAGIRLGFAITTKELAGYLNRARSPFNISALTQAAATVMLSDTQAMLDASEQLIIARKELEIRLKHAIATYPERITMIPTVTNFALLQCDQAPFYYEKLKENGICVRLIQNKYLRITAGNESENFLVANTLKKILDESGKKE